MGFDAELLADALHKAAMLHMVSGLQVVDFGKRIALVVEDEKARIHLVEHGLNVTGIHVSFIYHKRWPKTIVYVCNLPLGIEMEDICERFAMYGKISDIQPICKIYHGRKLDSGDRFIIFDQLRCNIPSYIAVRG